MRGRPDVALISLYPPPGATHAGRSGVASYTANLARAMAGHGADVLVLAPREPGLPATCRDDGIEVRRAFSRGAAALPAAAAAAIRSSAPLVHLQHELFLYGGASSVPGLAPALTALRGAGRRTVATTHQVVDPAAIDRRFVQMHRVRAPSGVARAGLSTVQRLIGSLCDAVVVHEPAFAPIVRRSVVIPHGVEPLVREERTAARRRLGLEDGRLVALCFGFVAPYKGLETALRAAEGAADAVQLVVAGGEHPRLAGRDAYATALRARWGGSARFTGYIPEDDVASWFGAADVALFPYPQPFSSSGALALALGYGTPVLVSPAMARTLHAPEAMTAPDDPAELARMLRALASDPARLRDLADASGAMGRGRSWDAAAQRHLDLYREVLRGDRAPGRRVRAG